MRTRDQLLAGATLLVCIGCASNKDDDAKTITLGAVVDQTGSAGPISWAEATKLAASQMNEALDSAGSNVRFNLVVSDSTNKPDVAVKRARQLVDSEGAVGLVVDTSQDYLEVMKLQYDDEPLNVPVVGLIASSPAINNPNVENPDALVQKAYRDTKEWGFRTTISSAPQGAVLAQIVLDAGDVNEDGLLKVSVFASKEPFGLGQVAAFAGPLAAEAPDAVVEQILFDPAEADPNDVEFFADTLAELVDEQTDGEDDGAPDILLGLTFPDHLAAIIKAHKQAKSKIRFVHGMALRNQKILDSLGSDANGQEGVSFVIVSPDASGDNFASDMEALTDLPPNSMDSSSYDAAATLMLAALIAAQGEDDPSTITGKQVREAMASISDLDGKVVRPGVKGFTTAVNQIEQGKPINYEGAQGPCDFDEHGNVTNDLIRFVITKGAFDDQEIYDCVSSPSCPVK
ncbi:MAG: ABC transporter substrate-binding protein [Polyangiaceae bacterium]|nr:ABC transporter substrate-binding protein [Polyangiaceae bacterium]